MFEPVRGGTRGGQAEFKWSDVSQDKDREHYLGHSINAPTGRWQKNKDVHWYNRDVKQTETEKQAELRRIKEAEAEAIAQVLGFAPTKKSLDATTSDDVNSPPTGGAGAESISVPEQELSKEKLERRMRKLEKRARKAEKKARKEAKRLERRREEPDSESEPEDRYRDRRRSLSPRRRHSRERDSEYRRRRSSSPSRARRHPTSPISHGGETERRNYDALEQERERERDRRRWDASSARDLPHGYRPR